MRRHQLAAVAADTVLHGVGAAAALRGGRLLHSDTARGHRSHTLRYLRGTSNVRPLPNKLLLYKAEI